MTIDDVTSGSQATSGHAQWYILYYYYSKKKAWEPVVHAHAITSDHVTSSDVISGQGRFRDVTSGSFASLLLKCDFGCPYILLWLSLYTTLLGV